MKRLLRCEHALEAAHLANALRAAGIPCEVRNTRLSGALGEIPWLECAPQVWLCNAADEARALALLCALKTGSDEPDWTCARCGEVLEAQFDQCWRCGASRPA